VYEVIIQGQFLTEPLFSDTLESSEGKSSVTLAVKLDHTRQNKTLQLYMQLVIDQLQLWKLMTSIHVCSSSLGGFIASNQISDDGEQSSSTYPESDGNISQTRVSSTDETSLPLYNPLALEKSTYIKDSHGRPRQTVRIPFDNLLLIFARISWSLFHLVFQSMIRDHLNQPDSIEVVNFDASAYMLDLSNCQAALPPDISGLPTLDLALYLTNTVKFNICQTFNLFDEIEFTKTLHDFYNSPAQVANKSRLWYVQFLVVIAFGKAFLQQGRADSTPPGSIFFVRAMNLLPSSESLYSEPVPAIETLCMISLYLQSADMRCSAYSYVSDCPGCCLAADCCSDWTSAAHRYSTRYAPRDAGRISWTRALPTVA